jgi:HTH-type transcriptional repressor of NAD biosynthesis genes
VAGLRVAERRALRSARMPYVICDTDVLATALFHEHYEGSRAPHLLTQAREHLPALYLLAGDEIPFVQDQTRSGEQGRSALQERFREELGACGVEWLEVRGTVDERVATAVAAIHRVVPRHLEIAPPLG